ncbi:MAG: dockerin type I domain-containing protein, partial [Methanosarcinaceae archaeon]|nr:dockerin type I domain-containing protein [Methanosarcinaceae archaeon]
DQVTDQHIVVINNVLPRWDVNEDGIVDVLDIAIIGQEYGALVEAPYPRWDVIQDGVINVQDMTLARSYFGGIVV